MLFTRLHARKPEGAFAVIRRYHRLLITWISARNVGSFLPLPGRGRVGRISIRRYIATRRRSQIGRVFAIHSPKYPENRRRCPSAEERSTDSQFPTCPRGEVRQRPHTDAQRRVGKSIRSHYIGCLLWRAARALPRRASRAREDVPLQRAIIRNPLEGIRGGSRIVFWDSCAALARRTYIAVDTETRHQGVGGPI